MRVLVIEDYEPVREAVAQGLRESGFAVDETADGAEGLWYAQNNPYDVIVLDIMLPTLDGMQILRTIRSENSDTGVLMLTAKDAVDDRVRGLNAGADDYLIKPFAFEELLARVQVLIRHRYDCRNPVIQIDNLKINTNTKTVERGDLPIRLTRREYALLVYLAMRQNQTVSRTDIWENLYDFHGDGHSNVVDVYIRYLRRKLERPEWTRLIHTRRGFGYVLGKTGDTE
ncbi:MAG: response regulator transcription factor [Planctomycetaceae bacterium]|nr:response regulator transcription factor [Planctomycetaceae bacterium]